MEDRLKRRLVGAIVLVSLAVIFLPMLLERPDDGRPLSEVSNIPPKPPELENFRSSVVALPDVEPLIPPPATPALTEEAPVDATAEPEPVAEPEAQADEPAAQAPQALVGVSSWVVQVASLSSSEGAARLVADLRAKGHTAFMEQTSVRGKDLFRVRVGPEIDRKRAERAAAAIDAAFKVKSRVLRYP